MLAAQRGCGVSAELGGLDPMQSLVTHTAKMCHRPIFKVTDVIDKGKN